MFVLSLHVVAYTGFTWLGMRSCKQFTFRGILLWGLGAKGLAALYKCASFFQNICKVFQYRCVFNITFLGKLC